MKLVVWLMLLSFGTALAQVQPVRPARMKIGECCCCADKSSAGACAHDTARGMEDCLPCGPACAATLITLLPVTTIAVVICPAEISRLDWQAEAGVTLAYPPLLTPPRAGV